MNHYIARIVLFLSISNASLFAYATSDYVTIWKTTTANEDVVIPTYAGFTYNYDVDCENDGVFEHTGVTGDATCTYSTAGEHTVVIQGTFPFIYINNGASKEKILEIKQWGDTVWASLSYSYYGASNLNITATDVPNLTNVSMSTFAFHSTDLSTANNINNWDVSNIQKMAGMFLRSSFNTNINDWDVSKVSDMTLLFAYTPFNQDLGNWDVSHVQDLYASFAYSPFNKNISNWNVSAVTDMGATFAGTPFNQNIGNWDVSSVEDLHFTFAESSFNQDISSWDVSNVTNIDDIFEESSFNQDVTNWELSSIDENDDGIKDGTQTNIATKIFTTADGRSSSVTATSSAGTIVVTPSTQASPNSNNYTAPYGKFKVDITGISSGSDQTIRLEFRDDIDINALFKYNNASGTYELYPSDSIVHDTTNKKIVFTYTVVNGGAYDLDSLDDTAIYDPVIPVLPALGGSSTTAVPISNTRYMLFALAILFIGLRQVVRR